MLGKQRESWRLGSESTGKQWREVTLRMELQCMPITPSMQLIGRGQITKGCHIPDRVQSNDPSRSRHSVIRELMMFLAEPTRLKYPCAVSAIFTMKNGHHWYDKVTREIHAHNLTLANSHRIAQNFRQPTDAFVSEYNWHLQHTDV